MPMLHGMLNAQPRTIKAAGEQVHVNFNASNNERITTDFVPWTGGGVAYTVLFWVRGPSGQDSRSDVVPFLEWGDGSGVGTRVTIGIKNSDNLHMEIGGAEFDHPDVVLDGTWHHVAMTYNGNGDLSGFTLLLDGQTPTSTSDTTNCDIQDDHLDIGYGNGIGSYVADPYFNGDIDDVRLFRRELTQEEVQWHLREWITGREPDLDMWFPMWKGSGTPENFSPKNISVTNSSSLPDWEEG